MEIKNFDALPAILQAKHLAEVMGISIPKVYELMNDKDFPSVKVGKKRIIVPKDAFVSWLCKHTSKDGEPT